MLFFLFCGHCWCDVRSLRNECQLIDWLSAYEQVGCFCMDLCVCYIINLLMEYLCVLLLCILTLVSAKGQKF